MCDDVITEKISSRHTRDFDSLLSWLSSTIKLLARYYGSLLEVLTCWAQCDKFKTLFLGRMSFDFSIWKAKQQCPKHKFWKLQKQSEIGNLGNFKNTPLAAPKWGDHDLYLLSLEIHRLYSFEVSKGAISCD